MISREIATPLGPMLALANDDGVILLEFVDRRGMAAQMAAVHVHFGKDFVIGSNRHLDHLMGELGDYFAGRSLRFSVPIVRPASPFQALVWDALREIPPGKTASYGQIARSLGRPGASRAVGRANGENRLAIVVPCHRVVRSDGQLCGYAGGVERKTWLLDHERRFAGVDRDFSWSDRVETAMISSGGNGP